MHRCSGDGTPAAVSSARYSQQEPLTTAAELKSCTRYGAETSSRLVLAGPDYTDKICSRWHGSSTITQGSTPCGYVDAGDGSRRYLRDDDDDVDEVPFGYHGSG